MLQLHSLCKFFGAVHAPTAASDGRWVLAVAIPESGSAGSIHPRWSLRTEQLLLGYTKLESTLRYLGIEVDDALEIPEQTDV